ncbi:MAG: hypothetical protein QNJ32_17910 [Xenococcaceae cyanobacterium MO_167.B27]|nr:hypothetical protein [Xenococcaceae cyanobacterium MO_167.B27]
MYLNDDKLYGDSGDDRLYGDAGNDSLTGGSGNDYLVGSSFSYQGTGEADILTSGSTGDRDIFVTLSFLLTSGIKKILPFRSFIFSLGKATSFRALPSAPLASTYFLPSFSQNFNLKAGSKLKLSQKLSYIEPLIFDFEEIIKI